MRYRGEELSDIGMWDTVREAAAGGVELGRDASSEKLTTHTKITY